MRNYNANMKWRTRPASMVLAKLKQRQKRENVIMTIMILALLAQVTALILMFEPPLVVDINIMKDKGHIHMAEKLIPRIDKGFPSADTIKAILTEEQHTLVNHNGKATVGDMAKVYELVYAFIAAFQRHDIPIFVGYGSHLGARRHHGIIPSGEKDVDFEVFSLDEAKISEIINEVLHMKDSWSNITVGERDFGFQLNDETMTKHGFKYYIDFFLFDSNIGNDKHIVCRGRQVGITNGIIAIGHVAPKPKYGCNSAYTTYYGLRSRPPQFQWSDYFPPVYQVFGSHRVPIPRTSRELETSDYNGDEENWNTTCGSHRFWNIKIGRYSLIPKEGRECAKFYEEYPFVFKAANGTEDLRQGNVIIHKSKLEA